MLYKVHINFNHYSACTGYACIEILPDVEYMYAVRAKQLKKRMLEELPRRSSDRIAIKTAVKEEEVSTWGSILWVCLLIVAILGEA